MNRDERWVEIRRLRAGRARSRFLRVSVLALFGLFVYAWLSGEIDVRELLSERRTANLRRFITHDAWPYPLRESGFEWGPFAEWCGEILSDRGLAAAAATLWISILAIVLAAGAAALATPFVSRALMKREPYQLGASRTAAAGPDPWRAAAAALRVGLVVVRAVPELVWAFLLLAMLGSGAWPAVLALAVHNAGILGRLGGETVDNLDPRPARALRSLGASRTSITWTALRPAAFPRFLLYVFYRYETCVREATVLGMLGVLSLGYWIQESRARQHYDEMLLLVALGAALVLLGDALSYVARAWVRRST